MKNNVFAKLKLKIAIVLTIILILIFAKNIIDKKHIDELEESFISVYEDRLVVQDYIFTLTEQLFRMRLLVSETESLEDYENIKEDVIAYHDSILAIIADFEKTDLTPSEASYLEDFSLLIRDKLEIESYFSNLNFSETAYEESVSRFNTDFERVIVDLRELSKIQLEEGERLTDRSYRIKTRSDIWTQFELAILFILLIIIFVLVLTSKSIRGKTN